MLQFATVVFQLVNYVMKVMEEHLNISLIFRIIMVVTFFFSLLNRSEYVVYLNVQCLDSFASEQTFPSQ